MLGSWQSWTVVHKTRYVRPSPPTHHRLIPDPPPFNLSFSLPYLNSRPLDTNNARLHHPSRPHPLHPRGRHHDPARRVQGYHPPRGTVRSVPYRRADRAVPRCYYCCRVSTEHQSEPHLDPHVLLEAYSLTPSRDCDFNNPNTYWYIADTGTYIMSAGTQQCMAGGVGE